MSLNVQPELGKIFEISNTNALEDTKDIYKYLQNELKCRR